METNELKQKAIEAAYGKYWEINKENIDENGWINCFLFPELAGSGVQEDSECGFFVRPKSLQGIETNNGWISVLSEKDLPKERTFVWCMVKNEKEPILAFTYTGQFGDYFFHDAPNNYEWKQVTHYQPITKPKTPIY